MTAIAVDRADGILSITFQRPEKHNALLPEDLRLIRAELADLGDARAVVFRGARGRAFSAGMHVAA